MGGQNLAASKELNLSGKGVRAQFVHYIPYLRGQRWRLLQRNIEHILKQHKNNEVARTAFVVPKNLEGVKLPNQPPFTELDSLSNEELRILLGRFRQDKKKQENMQIAETAVFEVTVLADAQPGDRELRIRSGRGMSNPMIFQIDTLPELCEAEPNSGFQWNAIKDKKVANVPVLLNGQIFPGDVDRHRFKAAKGDKLVMETKARHLVPFMADAVPGWLQATLALYDSKGNELAFADDNGFDPDPMINFRVPEDGEYDLEIHDSIFRGREDFVYRVSISNGAKPAVAKAPAREKAANSNAATMPMIAEKGENNTRGTAQKITLPTRLRGAIESAGDKDVFRFDGKKEEEIVLEVVGRRTGSPLDSLLKLTSANGEVVAWNDDQKLKNTGTQTHQADSYLRATLPADGVYFAHVADTRGAGGKGYYYHLRLSPPKPGFELFVTPSTINLHAGLSAPVTVHAIRKDGFDGDIHVFMPKNEKGFGSSGGRIPAGQDSIAMTISAPLQGMPQPVALALRGRAVINGKTVRRVATPAEDMVQAFLWRHLTPSKRLMACVIGGRRGVPAITLDMPETLVLSPGKSAKIVVVAAVGEARLKNLKFETVTPPKGVTLGATSITQNGIEIAVNVDSEVDQQITRGNLIVSVLSRAPANAQNKKRKAPLRNLGTLPAIPYEVSN